MSAKKFIIGFILSFMVGLSAIALFVSWVDPYRTIEAPWSIPYVSDRNLAYKRLTLMKENKEYTDLIVGSSTSEAFSPKTMEEKFGRKAFLASAGGASAALRSIYVRAALKTNPHLQKIIYITDLFEFKDLFLYNEVYFQPELRSYLDEEDMDMIEYFGPLARLESFIERKVIDRSFRTLKDYKKFQKGEFQSEFRPDGSTTTSMIFLETNEPFATRVHRTAVGHQSNYKNMEKLYSPSQKMFSKTVDIVKKNSQVELHIVIPPVHKDYYNYFKQTFEKTNVYNDWVKFIKSHSNANIIVHDFSYPNYQNKGITDEEIFWNDGVHFNGNTVFVILNEIYKK